MHDLVIREVSLYDGGGAPPLGADVAIEGERIAAVRGCHAGSPLSARETIDGRGLALAPGFIDVHTHDDFAALALCARGEALHDGGGRLPHDRLRGGDIRAVFVNGRKAVANGAVTGVRTGRVLRRS